jgi:uncharacterized protein
MNNLKKLLVTMISFCVVSAFAAPPTAQSVETLILNNGLKSGLDNAATGIQTRMQQSMLQAVLAENKGTPISSGQRAAMDKVTPPVTAILKEELSFEKLKPDFMALYQQNLTQEEVNQLIALYKQPGYVDLMRKMQVIHEKVAVTIQQKLPVIIKRIEPVLEKGIQEVLDKK